MQDDTQYHPDSSSSSDVDTAESSDESCESDNSCYGPESKAWEWKKMQLLRKRGVDYIAHKDIIDEFARMDLEIVYCRGRTPREFHFMLIGGHDNPVYDLMVNRRTPGRKPRRERPNEPPQHSWVDLTLVIISPRRTDTPGAVQIVDFEVNDKRAFSYLKPIPIRHPNYMMLCACLLWAQQICEAKGSMNNEVFGTFPKGGGELLGLPETPVTEEYSFASGRLKGTCDVCIQLAKDDDTWSTVHGRGDSWNRTTPPKFFLDGLD